MVRAGAKARTSFRVSVMLSFRIKAVAESRASVSLRFWLGQGLGLGLGLALWLRLWLMLGLRLGLGLA